MRHVNEIGERGHMISSSVMVFSVKPFKIHQNNNQNRSIDKVENLEKDRM